MRRFSEGSAGLALGLAAVFFAAFFAGAPDAVLPDSAPPGAVSPGSVFECFCVLILLGYSPPPRRVPARGAGCTLRDGHTRWARLGASAAQFVEGAALLLGGAAGTAFAFGDRRHGEVGGARSGEVFVAGDGDGCTYVPSRGSGP